MPLAEPDYIEFVPSDPTMVVARMEGLAVTHKGWVNFQPAVYDDDVPSPRSAAAGIFTPRGPEVPLATWTPGEVKRKGTEPPTIGISHGSGPKAAARLAAAGKPVPQGWVVLNDHPKRGLVVAVPPTVAQQEVLTWLLAASESLSTIPLTGKWRASVYG